MGTIFRWICDRFTALKGFNVLNTKHDGIETLDSGQQAEKMAAQYLQQQGLKLVKKNYLTKGGEIDLIMRHDQCLVFVEVKYRHLSDWAHAAETVTYQKQQKIIKAAKQYLQQAKLFDQVDCRFDVVAMDGNDGKIRINWIQHAFF